MSALIPWAEWKPDVSSYKGAHTQLINNVLPRGEGYGPVPSLAGYSDALGAACRGAHIHLHSDGTLHTFAGTSTALFKLGTDLSWDDVSRTVGGAYSVASDNQWQFTSYGSQVIAVNGTDAVQAYTVGSSTDFAALGGSPPIASYVTTVGPFIVLSGLASTPYRIAWSARNNSTGWTAGSDGSDVQDFNSGGRVQGVTGGEFGWVFQEGGAVRRMTYVAGDLGFEFDLLTENEGLLAPYSLIRGADQVFYLSNAGFKQLLPNGTINRIGKEKFDRTFLAEWDSNEPRMMIGAYDPRSTRVWWFYKTLTGATGLFNKAIVFDYAIGRAAPVDVTGEYACILGQGAVTLEQLDSVLGFTNIDTMTGSLDDYPAGFEVKLGAFNSSHVFGFFTGDNLEATLETSRDGLDARKRSFVRSQRPDTDAATVYGSVKYRQRLADAETQSAEVAMNDVGFVPHRVDGRITGFKNRIPSATSWTYSIGVEPDLVPTGLR